MKQLNLMTQQISCCHPYVTSSKEYLTAKLRSNIVNYCDLSHRREKNSSKFIAIRWRYEKQTAQILRSKQGISLVHSSHRSAVGLHFEFSCTTYVIRCSHEAAGSWSTYRPFSNFWKKNTADQFLKWESFVQPTVKILWSSLISFW